MKKILLLILFSFCLISVQAQSFELNIVPYTITDTAKTMFIKIMGNTDSTVTFYYELRNREKVIEFRNIVMPIEAAQEIFKNPLEMPNINYWLSEWGIEAIGRKDN